MASLCGVFSQGSYQNHFFRIKQTHPKLQTIGRKYSWVYIHPQRNENQSNSALDLQKLMHHQIQFHDCQHPQLLTRFICSSTSFSATRHPKSAHISFSYIVESDFSSVGLCYMTYMKRNRLKQPVSFLSLVEAS